MPIEISLTLKNEEKRLTKKHLSYEEDLVVSWENDTILNLSQEARKEFNAPVDTEVLSLKMIR